MTNSSNQRVFISYTETDELVVRQIAGQLREANFEVWFAPASLTVSDEVSAIGSKISETDIFVVALSQAAVNSAWVQYEIGVALASRFKGKPLRIVPVFLEPISRPANLAAFISFTLSRDNLDTSLSALIAVLRGEPPTPVDLVSRFSFYVESLVRVPPDIHDILDTNELVAGLYWWDGSSRNVDPELRQRGRENIERALIQAGVQERDRLRVIQAYDTGTPLPIVDGGEYGNIRNWIRQFADEALLRLALALWETVTQSQGGVTLRWIVEEITDQVRGGAPDLQTLDWQAERLASRAQAAGLLARSTEWNHPRTHAYQDAQGNPSYDIGPMVRRIGKLMNDFQRQAASRE